MALITGHVIADSMFFLLLITILALIWFHPRHGRKASHAPEKAGTGEEHSNAIGIHKKAA